MPRETSTQINLGRPAPDGDGPSAPDLPERVSVVAIDADQGFQPRMAEIEARAISHLTLQKH